MRLEQNSSLVSLMPKGKKQRPWKVKEPTNSCKEKTGASKSSSEGKTSIFLNSYKIGSRLVQ